MVQLFSPEYSESEIQDGRKTRKSHGCRMKKVLCYFILLLFPALLSAQINESDTLGLKANLSLTGFWQAGNVETLIFRANSDVSFKPLENWVFKTQNSYVYQEFGKQKADEDILSLNFLYLHPERKVYPLLLGFVSTNYRREIDLRYLLGLGASFQIVEGEKNWLKCSISSEYEQTNFAKANFNRSGYDGNFSIDTFRATVWISGNYHLLNDRVILSHQSYYQPSLERSNNYRWQANVSLELPIWEFLNFKVNYQQTFESVVIKNQKQEDRFLTFGVTLKSY
jgi:hypothetical protein